MPGIKYANNALCLAMQLTMAPSTLAESNACFRLLITPGLRCP